MSVYWPNRKAKDPRRVKPGWLPAHADDELIGALDPGSGVIDCSADRTLFMQGEEPSGVYLIKSGEAALVMHSDAGEVVMCARAGPGSLIGLPGAIANEPYSMTALARRGSHIRFTSSNNLKALLAANPALYPSVLDILAAEVREARQAVLDARDAVRKSQSAR